MKSLQQLALLVLAIGSTAWAQVPDMTQSNTPAPRRFFGRTQPTPAQEPLMPATPTNVAPPANEGVSRPVTSPDPTPRARTRPATRNTPAPNNANRRNSNNAANTRERVIAPRNNNSDDEVVAADRPAARNRGASQPSAADEATSAVADLLDAANRGQYTKSANMLTPQLLRYLDSDSAAPSGGLKGALDRLTRDGDVSGWETVARARGEGARAETKITYRSGQTENVVFELIRSENRWKISVSPIWITGKATGGGGNPVAMPSFHTKAPAAAVASPVTTPSPEPTAAPAASSKPVAQAENEPPAAPAASANAADPRPTPMATPRPALSDVPWQVDLRPQDVLKAKQPAQ